MARLTMRLSERVGRSSIQRLTEAGRYIEDHAGGLHAVPHLKVGSSRAFGEFQQQRPVDHAAQPLEIRLRGEGLG